MSIKLVPNSNGEPEVEFEEGGWIQSAIKNPGALHDDLGIPRGKKIPLSLIQQAAQSKNPTLRRRANLALTLRKITHRNARKRRAEKEDAAA